MASLPYPRSHKTIFPQNARNTQKRLAEKKNLCTSVKSAGGSSPPEASGGEEPPADFTDVHRFFFSASRFCVFRAFCGKIVLWLRGYGRDAIPS